MGTKYISNNNIYIYIYKRNITIIINKYNVNK